VANEANLTAALEKYCVPKCTSGCNAVFKATYQNGACICNSDNLEYNKEMRECIIKCPMGMYAFFGDGCPLGTYMHSADVCPTGTYKGIGRLDLHGFMADADGNCPTNSLTINAK
jgi:hypothetical protein